MANRITKFRRRLRARSSLSTAGQLAGAALVCFGLWQVWEPLTYLVGGGALMVVSFGFGEDGKP